MNLEAASSWRKLQRRYHSHMTRSLPAVWTPRKKPYPVAWFCGELDRARLQPSAASGLSRHKPNSPPSQKKFNDYDLHYVLEGSMLYRFPDRTIRLRSGGFIVIPPGVRFSEENNAAQSSSLYFCHFELGTGPNPFRALELPLVVRSTNKASSRKKFEALVKANRARRDGDPWASLHAHAHFVELLTMVLEMGARTKKLVFDPKRAGPDWLWDILEQLEKEVGHAEFRVEDLARRAHISSSQFAHQFRRYVGTSPKKMLLAKRMERACSLLLSNEALSIKQIGSRCGFTDPYHFSAQFKKWAQVAPSEFRNRRDMG